MFLKHFSTLCVSFSSKDVFIPTTSYAYTTPVIIVKEKNTIQENKENI